ncbi:MAG: FAD-dependent oxidoreductase, partial [Planctomycetota bacterium]
AKIEVCLNSEINEMSGDEHLERVQIRNRQSGDEQRLQCSGAFIFVGAKPHTDWLPESVALDKDGFVLTGPSIQNWGLGPLDRAPCELETTAPGVFAAGDVRSGTTKRCAFAAGDGALGITCVHQHLARNEA